MTSLLAQAPDLNADDYVVIGLATCFLRDEDGVKQVKVIEPIPSSAFEALLKGVPTSYSQAIATTIGQVLTDSLQMPSIFPAEAEIGEEFANRAIAAARTFKRRPQSAEHLAVGSTYDSFAYSIERKRVLNAHRNVTKDDNVKQHSHTHAQL
jgi:hypothetical protein